MAYIGENPSAVSLGHAPQTTDPANPVEGDVFYSDGTPRAEGLWVWTNGAWVAVAGSPILSVVSKNVNYTATVADDVILVDDSGADRTITLYTAAGNDGRQITITKDVSSTNKVIVDGSGTETIRGQLTFNLATEAESITLVSDGTNWSMKDHTINEAMQTFTPTGSWTTNVTYNGFWRRVGDHMHVTCELACTGAPGPAVGLTVAIPSGYTIDTTKILGTTGNDRIDGNSQLLDSGVLDYTISSITYSSTTVIRPTYDNGSGGAGGFIPTAPITFANGDFIRMDYRIPIVDWEG